MKCCNELAECIFIYDDPNSGFAFNLYGCSYCGAIYKDMVWDNKGISKCNVKEHLNERVEK